MKLEVKKRGIEGDIGTEYYPLFNLQDSTGEIKDFNIEYNADLKYPWTFDISPSYDGTVNLIVNDDNTAPKIINSRFTRIEGNRYRIINRNQNTQTNLYNEDYIDKQTQLIRNVNSFPKIDLYDIHQDGKLTGGMYTIYITLSDEDFNETDIVAESGQIIVYKGSYDEISSINGSLSKEATNKSIKLYISDLDTSFSKLFVYYSIDTSDLNGVRTTNYYKITNPYNISNNNIYININGYEEVTEISSSEININYHRLTKAKTTTRVQNMLFFGNVEEYNYDVSELQQLAYKIKVEYGTGSIGKVDTNYNSSNYLDSEYYSPFNVYYKVGYFPEELYRLGIVYITNNDTLTSVFPLRGIEFTDSIKSNIDLNNINIEDTLSNNIVLDKNSKSNTFGVFRMPKKNLLKDLDNNVLYLKCTISKDLKTKLISLGIKGYFFVRQKRIPTIIAQGVPIGIDSFSYTPLLYDSISKDFYTEKFISKDRVLTTDFNTRKVHSSKIKYSGLISADISMHPTLQSTLNGSKFILDPYSKIKQTSNSRTHIIDINGDASSSRTISKLLFVPYGVKNKSMDNYFFCTKAGTEADTSEFLYLEKEENLNYKKEKNFNFLRGNYTSFVGTSIILDNNTLYNIRIEGYSDNYIDNYFDIRKNDNSPFYAISDRILLKSKDENDIIYVYRGDCFINTVTVRFNSNFVDPTVPVNDTIVDPNTWKKSYKGKLKMTKNDKDSTKTNWNEINRSDTNTVPIGIWVTYKCLSNYNLGIRSVDPRNADENALMGSPRIFYPYSSISLASTNKIPESVLLNDGYSSTVGHKEYYYLKDVPYTFDLYDNRIMFSKVQRDNAFKNSYRILEGLCYQDYDRQYGGIVKLIAFNQNLLCIFEHGIAIIPVNEKALMSTTTGQSIHLYGSQVLSKDMTVISPDFGTIWQDSIIETPIGIYGVDTYAKKIWVVKKDGSGFSTISDMKVQQFLNDHIQLSESDKYPIIGMRNVKSHYNAYKGDVMFTFYNDAKKEYWNLCYNERLNNWITRYSWIPLYSANINNQFYSLDWRRVNEISAIQYRNNYKKWGVVFKKESNDTLECVNDWIFSNTVGSSISIPGKFYWLEDIGKSDSECKYLNIKQISLSFYFANSTNGIDEVKASDISYREGTGITFTVNKDISDYAYLKFTYKVEIGDKVKTKEDNSNFDSTQPESDTNPKYITITTDSTNCINQIYTDTIVLINSKYVDGATYKDSDNKDKPYDNGTVANNLNELSNMQRQVKTFFQNGFYLHGRAGIFDEISYTDESWDNQLLPTRWYDRQEPFEFEFVVNDNIGLHKIFDNLVIISNKVQPSEIEYEISGDVYRFNKAGIFRAKTFRNDYLWANDNWKDNYGRDYNIPLTLTKVGNDEVREKEMDEYVTGTETKYQNTQDFKNTEVKWDTHLNSYSLVTTQECKNIEKYGRRLGNIQYKEGSWYLVLDPIKYTESYKLNEVKDTSNNNIRLNKNQVKEVKPRDKYMKIRIKYTGEDIVIISEIQTIFTGSYA